MSLAELLQNNKTLFETVYMRTTQNWFFQSW